MTLRSLAPLLTSFLLLLPGALRATTAVTPPVGYVRHAIASGFQVVGVTLLHEPTVVATITSTDTAGTLVLNTSANIGALLEANRPYYVEFTNGPGNKSGPFVGDRLEVDVPATIAVGTNRVIIRVGDTTNTLPGSGINLAGYQATLHAHVTIADVFGDADNRVLQSGDAATADEIHLYDTVMERFRSYHFRATEVAFAPTAYWRAEDGTNANNLAIRPGEGVLVNRRSAAATETIVMGEVRTNDFVQPLKAGLNFVAGGFPNDQTPRNRLMDENNGFRAAAVAVDADRFYIFSSGAWHQYFLAAGPGAAHWCNPAKPRADFSAATLFSGGGAALVFRHERFPDYVIPSQVN